ncbi:Quercetin 2,3-dioxygenase [Terricaulis silvestris]|uniref:Quercetin 2,3-dioxygenase n=1 Tax=Terricaulis silvestris TaxID=2686094 RepID=A0A6I6MLY2_9CAUL|nr:Quercetin 2,3-dioxygenase [Terricaulis silvestris]
MIERRPFAELPSEDFGWLKVRRHLSADANEAAPGKSWGALRVWSDHEFAPNGGFPLHAHANVEIVTYVREGALTHRDSLGNEGRIEAGSIQVLSAGTGLRHTEYNLEHGSLRLFQICISPASQGGAPAWGTQPCPVAERGGGFVAVASGCGSDIEALPIRARARVLNVKLKAGESAEYPLLDPGLAYLVPSSGAVEVNGTRIDARDGAAIRDVTVVRVTALEDADVVMVDLPRDIGPGRPIATRPDATNPGMR